MSRVRSAHRWVGMAASSWTGRLRGSRSTPPPSHTSPQYITACACLTSLLHTPSAGVEVEAQSSLPAVLSCCWEAESSSSLLRLVRSELMAEPQLLLEESERAKLGSCSGADVSSQEVVAFTEREVGGKGKAGHQQQGMRAARHGGLGARTLSM